MTAREILLLGMGLLALIVSYAAYILIGVRFPLTLLQRAAVFFGMEMLGTTAFAVLLSILTYNWGMAIVLLVVMPPLLLFIAVTNWNSERQWVKRIRELADRAELAETEGRQLDAAAYHLMISKQLRVMGSIPDLADIRAKIRALQGNSA